MQKILDLKGKFIVEGDLHKPIDSRLEEKIINLEKNHAKGEQYSRRNNIELSGLPNSILDEDLEDAVINVCR